MTDQGGGDRRPLWAGISLIILAIGAWEAVQLWGIIGDQAGLGVDRVFYVDVARVWLESGAYYSPAQLAGPYETQTLVHNLYPPHALFLFVPFVFLPAFAWWALPLGFAAYAVWWLRPRPWSWPLLALIVALPKTLTAVLYGNSDMWTLALVAAATLWGWPAVLISFKPSLGPFALWGIRRRSWWIAGIVLALVNLPLLPLWVQYPSVLLNSSSTLVYSLSNIPMVALPLVAWLASPKRPPLPGPARLARHRASVASATIFR